MLEFAKLYEDELLKKLRKGCDQERNKYFYIGHFSIESIPSDDWYSMRRVSTYGGNILGYLSASIDRTNGHVESLSMISFNLSSYYCYKVFTLDILKFLYQLLERFPVIQWSVVIGNPVRKTYIKLVNKFGGNIVGTRHKTALIRGIHLDEELYEIVSSKEALDKLQKLITRLERSRNDQMSKMSQYLCSRYWSM